MLLPSYACHVTSKLRLITLHLSAVRNLIYTLTLKQPVILHKFLLEVPELLMHKSMTAALFFYLDACLAQSGLLQSYPGSRSL
jgi:hypothetical protein